MKYILEFYYQGECIERREYTSPIIVPRVGERVRVEFQNPSYYRDGLWWIVKDVHHFLPAIDHDFQSIQVFIERDLSDGGRS